MRVPEGWRATTLGDVADLISGQHIPASQYSQEPVGIPYLTGPSDFPDGQIIGSSFTQFPRVVCEPKDVLITVKGSGVGKICIADRRYCISRQLAALRARDVDASFLCYVVESMVSELASGATGFIPGISRGQVLDLGMYLPPRSEQMRIAEILSRVDEVIQATQSVIEQTCTVKKGVLNRLMARGFGHGRFKQTEIGEIPEAWSIVTLSEVVRSLDAGVSVNSEGRTKRSDELGILKTSSVSTGTFCPDEHKVVLSDELGRVKTPVQADRIIISRMNTPNLVGASVYVDQDYPDLFLPDRLWQLDVKDRSQVNVRWLAQLLSWENTRERISGLASGTSGSMKNIPKSRLLEMKIPLPSIREQKKQALVISEFEGENARAVKEMHKLQAVKSALLSDLLTGRKRVSADALSAV